MRGRLALMTIVMIALLGGVAFYSYNLGMARGVVQGVAERAIAAAPGTAAAPVVFYPRPWGFGFGFFPFFPFLFILFAVFALRGLFWRRAWYGHGRYGYGYGCGRRRVRPGTFEV